MRFPEFCTKAKDVDILKGYSTVAEEKYNQSLTDNRKGIRFMDIWVNTKKVTNCKEWGRVQRRFQASTAD